MSVQVLHGTEISSNVVSLIENAKECLFLVSPYFDPWGRLAGELKRAAHRPNMQIIVLLRGGEDRAKQEKKAKEHLDPKIRVEYLERLHAKIYVSEQEALVTSMNLLESSALSSWEVAVRARRAEDVEVYKDIVEVVAALMTRAREHAAIEAAGGASGKKAAPPVEPAPARPRAAAVLAEAANLVLAGILANPPLPSARSRSSSPRARDTVAVTGHCIRCNADIALNADRPLCNPCYKAWAKYENAEYKENHCHMCGKERSVTFAKPLCKPCWQETQDA